MLHLGVFLCALALVTCRPNLKIIGGDDADIADWPWQGSVRYCS